MRDLNKCGRGESKMKEVIRKEYLEELTQWKNKQLIKVVTGMRRCGKSTLLKQYVQQLLDSGVHKSQIIQINFERLEFEEFLDYKVLYSYIKEHLSENKTSYIFLDEIQNVKSYEKVVDSLYTMDNTDLYITGSNAYMLSSDLATLLSGRYVEISILPLSFKEYLQLVNEEEEKAFSNYLRTGGLPFVTNLNEDMNQIDAYMEGIYNTVIIKDIEARQQRSEPDPNKRKISDVVLLKNIAKYLASTSSSLVSTKNVAGYITSTGRKVSQNTVSAYMEALSEAFIFYQVNRFAIEGKEILKGNCKWYIVDLGLRHFILPKSNYDLGCSIENVVYFELLRRGYRVSVGRLGNVEVDFVAVKGDETVYYQVTADMRAEETFAREVHSLKLIRDNYEKIVLTLDRFSLGNYEGIKVMNVIDWLIGQFPQSFR